MTYVLSALAAADLVLIHEYGLRTYGTQQADAYLAGIGNELETIGQFPLAARARPEFRRPLRIGHFGSHVIVYRVRGERAFILRVLHARQDWLNLL